MENSQVPPLPPLPQRQRGSRATAIIIAILVIALLCVSVFAAYLYGRNSARTQPLQGAVNGNPNAIVNGNKTPNGQADANGVAGGNVNGSQTVTPTGGPYTHQVLTATSTDGLTWTEGETLVEHASVPTALTFPNHVVRVYYVDAANGPDAFGCMESTDDGETFEKKTCAIEGLSSFKAVDFSIVALDDGRTRLYYYASGQQTDTKESHAINSAISTDGITFTEEGTVFTYSGMVDPDVFWNGSTWIMHVMSLTDAKTVVATSADGTEFTFTGYLSPAGYGVTKPVTLTDDTFRMYAFKQGQQTEFVSFTSTDGLTWTQEDGTRLTAPDDKEITDPYVVTLADGTYEMFYKLSPKNPAPANKQIQ